MIIPFTVYARIDDLDPVLVIMLQQGIKILGMLAQQVRQKCIGLAFWVFFNFHAGS